MPFLPPNQQRQSTEGSELNCTYNYRIINQLIFDIELFKKTNKKLAIWPIRRNFKISAALFTAELSAGLLSLLLWYGLWRL